MNTSRLNQLLAMLATEPNDSFVRYGVAMEYARANRHEDALKEFETLVQRDPKYVAGYFMAGRSCEALGRGDDARRQYERGIHMARLTGDEHAAAEMSEAMAALPPV